MTAVIFGRAQRVWYWRIATDKTLLSSQGLADLMRFVARGKLRHSSHGLKMANFAKVAARFGVLLVYWRWCVMVRTTYFIYRCLP